MVNSDLIKYFSLVNSDLFHWSIRTLSGVNSDLFHWSIRTLPVVNSENFYWSVRTLLVVDSINLVKPNQSLWKIFPWNNNEKQLINYLKKYIYQLGELQTVGCKVAASILNRGAVLCH